MKKNKLIVTALTLTVAVGLAACGNKSKPLEPETKETEQPTKITEQIKETKETEKVQETKETEKTQEKVELKDVEKDIADLMQGDENYPAVRDFTFTNNGDSVKLELVVEKGLTEGEAQGTANAVNDDFVASVKKHNPNIKKVPTIKIEVKEHMTDKILSTKEYNK